MKYLLVGLLLIAGISSYAQKRWYTGVTFYTGIPLTRMSEEDHPIIGGGVEVGRDLSLRTTLLSGLNFHRYKHSGTYHCIGACPDRQGWASSNFIEIVLVNRTSLTIKPHRITPHILYGGMVNIDFGEHSNFLDNTGAVYIEKEKGLRYNGVFFYTGLSLEYKLQEFASLYFEPNFRQLLSSYVRNPKSKVGYMTCYMVSVKYTLKF